MDSRQPYRLHNLSLYCAHTVVSIVYKEPLDILLKTTTSNYLENIMCWSGGIGQAGVKEDRTVRGDRLTRSTKKNLLCTQWF